VRERWNKCALGNLLQVQNGYAFSSKNFNSTSGIPLIRIRDLKSGVSTEVNFNGDFDFAYLVRKGDFLIGMDGEFRCYEWQGADALLNQRVCRLIEFSDALHPRFLFYGINKYLREIEDGTTFTTVKHLSSKTIKSIEFLLPPLDEQKRIVAILDEAFEGLDRAQANAEANLASAEELFESILQDVFRNGSSKWETNLPADPNSVASSTTNSQRSRSRTQTGGRDATRRPIAGPCSLSVLMTDDEPRHGWQWSLLTDFARLESGHTPSRKHPEYWGGEVPWVGIKDARDHHGTTITDTLEYTNALGIENSSARILPAGTVCLSRTASVGYVTLMGREMSTSQDFVNWICGDALLPEFLKFLLMSQGDEIRRFSSGSIHQTIYFPEVKAFHICHPPIAVQREICSSLERTDLEVRALAAAYEAKLSNFSDLRQSILQKAFSGELTGHEEAA